MTIASSTARIIYTGNGSTVAFSVPFYFAANADLIVILQPPAGAQVTQILGTNYNLTGATVSTGGTCTFTTAPTSGYLVTIYRDPAVTQLTSYNNNDPFPAKSHELALDKLTAIAQRLKDQISRTLHQAEGDGTMSTELAPASTRASRLLGFDSAGGIIYPTGPNVTVTTLTSPSSTPQGRLTIQSGVPVPITDIVGSQNLYYVPVGLGGVVPQYIGGVWTMKTFTANAADQVGLTLALAGSANWAADSTHDVFSVIDSGTLKLATRAWDAGMLTTDTQITNATTITTGTGASAWARSTIAFDGTTVQTAAVGAQIITSNNGMTNCLGQDWGVGITKTLSKVVVTASSDIALRNDAPTYMQISVESSTDGTNWHLMFPYRVNASVAGTVFTLPISISDQLPSRYHRVNIEGNGVHNLNVAEVQFFTSTAPVNGRRLTLRDGIWVNDAVITARTGASTTLATAQYEATYLGTIHVDTATAGQLTCHITFGPSRTYGVWNCYNRRPIHMQGGTNNTANTYTPNTSGLWNVCESGTQGVVYNVQAVCGLAQEWVTANLVRSVYLNCAANPVAYDCGISIDNITAPSGMTGGANIDIAGQAIGFSPRSFVAVPPFAGVKILYGLERNAGGTGVISSFTGPRNAYLSVTWMG